MSNDNGNFFSQPYHQDRWITECHKQRNENSKLAQEILMLNKKLAFLTKTLQEIAKYAGDNDCCPYGCDTPHIAKQALDKINT